MNEGSSFRVEVYSDTICPWCFVGKRRFEAALAERSYLAVELTWMPFQLNPDMPAEGVDRQEYLARKFGGAEQAKDIYAPIEAAGEQEGINFQFGAMVRTPNTLNSHRLIHYAKDQPLGQDSVVEALFESYFSRGEDIGDLEVLAECATVAGLDKTRVRNYLQSEDDKHQVEAQDVMAR